MYTFAFAIEWDSIFRVFEGLYVTENQVGFSYALVFLEYCFKVPKS